MPSANTIAVVAAHGSRADAANAAHRMLVEAVAQRSSVPVVPAFLELTEPSIPAAIDAAIADGAGRVLVLPYFLHPGRHLAEDLAEIVRSASLRHPTASVELLDLFGADPAMAELITAQIGTGLESS